MHHETRFGRRQGVGTLGERQLDRPSDHQGDDLVLGDGVGSERADPLAVAEDGEPVGDCHDLGEPVAHVQHTGAAP